MKETLTLVLVVTTLLTFQARAEADMNISLDDPKTGLAGNSMGDIVYDGKYVWVGTGDGLSYSPDSGRHWYTYDNTNGLNANDISALAVYNSTLWVACAYSRMIEGEPIPYGRGFNKTTNRGEEWESHIPEQVDYAGKLAYDIAFDDSMVWAACWYGGLIRSRKDGDTLTWENVFVSEAAKIDYDSSYYNHLDNRFFSVVVDTLCPIDKRLKNSINDIVYDGRFLWVGTQNGLHAIDTYKDTLTYLTFDTSNGLNANGVNSLAGYTLYSDVDTSSFLCAGLYTGVKDYTSPSVFGLRSEGFNFTTNYGGSWDTSGSEQPPGLGELAYSIAIADTVVWAAYGTGGLIRSFDWGKTWENVFADTSAKRRYEEGPLEPQDKFISFAVDTLKPDTTVIWAGTANGLYKFIYTDNDSADTVLYFLEGDELYVNSVLCLGIQELDPPLDPHTIVWASVRAEGLGPFSYSTYKSTDGGVTWTSYLDGVWVRNFAFQKTMAWAATNQGLKRTPDGGIYWETFEIPDTSRFAIPSNFTSVCISVVSKTDTTADTVVWVGAADGLAKSKDNGKTWEVIKFAQSFKKAVWAGTAAGIFKFIYNYREDFDTVLNYNLYSHGITGDFVVSTAIQEYDGGKIIWAGTQPAYSGGNGASISKDDGDSWSVTLEGDRVWNFAFDGSTVWAAASSGLKRSHDGGESWEVFNYLKDKDEITEDRIFSTEFTSVAIIDGEVWAGNSDGLAKAPKDVEVGEDGAWSVFRTAVPIGTEGSETAYAYPSPYSPLVASGEPVRIRHKPRASGPVTIKIYDFAMNLVTTLVDSQNRAGGEEYDEPWDGKNEKGDVVVNGVYFFRVEAPGGQTEWGKLVILK
jgi:hypothetical protein